MDSLTSLSFLGLLCLGLSFPLDKTIGKIHRTPASSPENKLRNVDWWSTGQQELQDNLKVGLSMGLAKNVILFVGDGMGVSTVSAARVFKAQSEGGTLQDTTLAWEDFPYTSLSKTYNVDQITPDSAGTATAMLTGIKTNHGMIGVGQETILGKCSTATGNRLKSILAFAHEEGKWTGVVSTARITHATPGAAYAAAANRDWEADSDIPDSEKDCKDIARQLVEENDFIRIMFGGGRQNFLPQNEADPEYPDYGTKRSDGRNLMKEWEEKQAAKVNKDAVKLVTNNTGFNSIDAEKAEYVMGLFEPSHMQYELDRDQTGAGEPSLAQMVEKSITMLKRSGKGYFLLVEGGRIDHAHHDNLAHKALSEAVAMSDAVQKAVELTSEADTLIAVTADHSHVFTFGGYQAPSSDILGISLSVKEGTKDELEVNLPGDGLPWLPLTYANGPGYIYHRVNGTSGNALTIRRNLTDDFYKGKTRDKDYEVDAGVYRYQETHGAEDVSVYARGPMSHLFRGTHEQTYIGHVLMYASCLGENKKHCTNAWVYPGCAESSAIGLDVSVAIGLFSAFVCLAVLRRLFY